MTGTAGQPVSDAELDTLLAYFAGPDVPAPDVVQLLHTLLLDDALSMAPDPRRAEFEAVLGAYARSRSPDLLRDEIRRPLITLLLPVGVRLADLHTAAFLDRKDWSSRVHAAAYVADYVAEWLNHTLGLGPGRGATTTADHAGRDGAGPDGQ